MNSKMIFKITAIVCGLFVLQRVIMPIFTLGSWISQESFYTFYFSLPWPVVSFMEHQLDPVFGSTFAPLIFLLLSSCVFLLSNNTKVKQDEVLYKILLFTFASTIVSVVSSFVSTATSMGYVYGLGPTPDSWWGGLTTFFVISIGLSIVSFGLLAWRLWHDKLVSRRVSTCLFLGIAALNSVYYTEAFFTHHLLWLLWIIITLLTLLLAVSLWKLGDIID